MRKEVNENFIKAFGENLRKVRMSKNVSMQTLAYTINVEYSQISRIELGKINTSNSSTVGTFSNCGGYLPCSLFTPDLIGSKKELNEVNEDESKAK